MDPNTVIRFRDCRILCGGSLIKEDLWIRNGKIINPEPLFFDERKSADIEIHCPYIISPGFIDIQINGKCIKQPLMPSPKFLDFRSFWSWLYQLFSGLHQTSDCSCQKRDLASWSHCILSDRHHFLACTLSRSIEILFTLVSVICILCSAGRSYLMSNEKAVDLQERKFSVR